VADRKGILLRLDPAVHDALARWASDELRSTNAQIEFLLRRALSDAGRMPGGASRMRGRGRPRKEEAAPATDTGEDTGEDTEEDPDEDEPANAGAAARGAGSSG
jgi:hypothetical protein